MKYETHIGLGDKVKEQITGFKGVVTAISFHITGCAQVLIIPTGKKSAGKQGQWFDETRVKVTKKQHTVIELTPKTPPGGPTPSDPPRKSA